MKNDELKEKAWLDDKGQILCESKLKKVCRHWSPTQWEDYLSSTEGRQIETLLDNSSSIESLSQEDHDKVLSAITNGVDVNLFPRLQETIAEALKQISKNQRQILHYLFWQDLSLKETAQILGVSKAAIQNARDRALTRIGGMLLQVASKPSPADEKVNKTASWETSHKSRSQR